MWLARAGQGGDELLHLMLLLAHGETFDLLGGVLADAAGAGNPRKVVGVLAVVGGGGPTAGVAELVVGLGKAVGDRDAAVEDEACSAELGLFFGDGFKVF